jgi:hypothetical protein
MAIKGRKPTATIMAVDDWQSGQAPVPANKSRRTTGRPARPAKIPPGQAGGGARELWDAVCDFPWLATDPTASVRVAEMVDRSDYRANLRSTRNLLKLQILALDFEGLIIIIVAP